MLMIDAQAVVISTQQFCLRSAYLCSVRVFGYGSGTHGRWSAARARR